MVTTVAGYIELNRPHQLRHVFAKLKVELDGNEVAQIRDDESIRLPVASGPHEIQVKMPWVSSPPTTITVADGETVKRRVETVGTPLRMFYAWGRYFQLV
jgi:hypothetical protein